MPKNIKIKPTTHAIIRKGKGRGVKPQFFSGVDSTGQQQFDDSPVNAKFVDVDPSVAALMPAENQLMTIEAFLDQYGQEILDEYGEIPDAVKAARARINSQAQREGPKKGQRKPRASKKDKAAEAAAADAGGDTSAVDPDDLLAKAGAK